MDLVSLDDLKSYLYVDHSLDDDEITYMGEEAEAFLKGNVGISGSLHFSSSFDETELKRFRFATKALVAGMYENRGSAIPEDVYDFAIKLINPMRGLL